MNKIKGIRYLIGCLLMCLCACQQQIEPESLEGAVELTFKLRLKEKTSRGLEGGDYLERVSVYLVDKNQSIVARKENISVENEDKEIEVVFEKSPDIKRGIHTLLAVANHGTLSTWTEDNYTALLNNKVHAINTTDFISPKDVIQPLSMMKEIELHAGNNYIEGELVRTFARLRIEVKNNSGSMPLKVKNLTFSEDFTQQQAYVFDDGTDRKYSFLGGTPIASSIHALTPFTTDVETEYKTIVAQDKQVLFDGYLLESKVAEGQHYTYTLDFNYDDIPYVTETSLVNVTDIENSNYHDAYFLIQNVRSNKFIRDNNHGSNPSLVQGGDSEDFLRTNIAQGGSKDYLWQLEHVSKNTYRIKNVSTNRYIGQPNSGTVPMSTSNDHNYKFYNFQNNSTDASSTGVQMRYKDWNGNYCLNDWSNQGRVIGGWSLNDDGGRFRFYKVEKTIKYDTPIVLTTIDPVTQQSSPATAIKRNDFIQVLVTVSYNPVAGRFEFEVQNWQSGGGEVDFN